ncbi:hypothetical protein MYA98_11550 [Salmonella sp. WGH-01]|nr:hypothetical protein MYA98_11550 [Salmonella sp. WGH-01]
MFCDPVFAEVCTGKRINRPDNRRFFQVVKRWALSTTAWSRRRLRQCRWRRKEKLFVRQKIICEPELPRFACLLPIF